MSATSRAAAPVAVLIALGVGGVLSAVVTVFYLPWRVGVVPVPWSALVGGALNLALVAAAARWTSSTRAAATPLWSWLGTVAVLAVGGPADDVMLGGTGVGLTMPILALAVGVGPALWWLQRR